jgi:hypothetical protein
MAMDTMSTEVLQTCKHENDGRWSY